MASLFAGSPDLPSRLAVGLTLFPLIIALSFLGPNWSLAALAVVAAGLSARELTRMVAPTAPRWAERATHLAIVVSLVVGYLYPTPYVLHGLAAFSLIFICVAYLASLESTENAHHHLGGLLFSWIYCAGFFGALVFLARPPVGDTPLHVTWEGQGFWFLLPMWAVWASDTGAYFAGKAFGRRKLAPVVSPGKSWEGAAGGVVASVAATYLLLYLAAPSTLPQAWWVAPAIAVPAATLGIMGDLAESLLKRSTGTKDSGKLLAGHGGILDRVDGMVFAAPWCLAIKLLTL